MNIVCYQLDSSDCVSYQFSFEPDFCRLTRRGLLTKRAYYELSEILSDLPAPYWLSCVSGRYIVKGYRSPTHTLVLLYISCGDKMCLLERHKDPISESE